MTKDYVVSLNFDHFDISTITNSFQLVSDAGLSAPCSFLRLINNSNITVIISYNGIDEHDCVIKETDLPILPQVNSRGANDKALFPQGTKIWVKGYGIIKVPLGMFYIAGF